MKLECKFTTMLHEISGYGIYTCIVKPADIEEPRTVIKKFEGDHMNCKTNDDVRGIQFNKDPAGAIDYFPKGLHEIFPKLTHVSINDCRLKEICRQDLQGLKSLVYLSANLNDIATFPDDLFADMENLRRIDFRDNEITSVSAKILEPIIQHLEFADFRRNKSVDVVFDLTVTMSKDELKKCLDGDVKNRLPEEEKSHDFPKAFAEKFERLWVTKDFSDLTIFVENQVENQQFLVHKTVLAVQSPAFREMFEQNPKFEPGQPTIHASAVAVEAFLEYLYTGKVPAAGNTMKVFKLAVIYKVTELEDICSKTIMRNIKECNALRMLKFARSYDVKDIEARAIDIIKSMFPGKEFDDEMINNIEFLESIIKSKLELDSMFAKYCKKELKDE